MKSVPANMRIKVILITIMVCKDSRFLVFLIIVVYKSEMTTKPSPPMMNSAAAIRGTDTEKEKRFKFSEKVEKPALQNADTE